MLPFAFRLKETWCLYHNLSKLSCIAILVHSYVCYEESHFYCLPLSPLQCDLVQKCNCLCFRLEVQEDAVLKEMKNHCNIYTHL